MSNISRYEFQKHNLGGNKQIKEKYMKILHVCFKMDKTTTYLYVFSVPTGYTLLIMIYSFPKPLNHARSPNAFLTGGFTSSAALPTGRKHTSSIFCGTPRISAICLPI